MNNNGMNGVDPEQRGVEAHAIKPPPTGLRTDAVGTGAMASKTGGSGAMASKGVGTGTMASKQVGSGVFDNSPDAEEQRAKDTAKAAKRTVQEINNQIKKEFSHYRQSARTSEERHRLRSVVDQLREHRDEVLQRTKTEKPPQERHQRPQFGVIDEHKKRVLDNPITTTDQGSGEDSYPFKVYLQTKQNGDRVLRVTKGYIAKGFSPFGQLAIGAIDNEIPTTLNVENYIYLKFELTKGLAIQSCDVSFGVKPWTGIKYFTVDASDPMRPYQKKLYHPKVIQYTPGATAVGIVLSESTQLVQLAKDNVQLNLWTIDGLPMYIPYPPPLFEP
jgi:hypothetical protein